MELSFLHVVHRIFGVMLGCIVELGTKYFFLSIHLFLIALCIALYAVLLDDCQTCYFH